MKIQMMVGVFLSLGLMCTAAFGEEAAGEYGVYQYVLESASGTLDEITNALEERAVADGWRPVAKIDTGRPKDCSYNARVLVLFYPDYATEIMKANRKTGPYAVLDRINLFQDENGTHIAVVNPLSINRTILMDDTKYEEMSKSHLQALREMITSSVQGKTTTREYGQKRQEGYIGRTFGIMAGGKFEDKIQDIAVASGNWKEVAEKVRKGLGEPGSKWGMHRVYEVELPEYQTVVFGSTGSPMDSRSFSIVKSGGDDSRKKLQCPGLAHAAAYPIEVVVAGEGENVKVGVVESMFRMKMYFEDAGKMAFMTNMSMPGSIQNELKGQVKKALESKK